MVFRIAGLCAAIAIGLLIAAAGAGDPLGAQEGDVDLQDQATDSEQAEKIALTSTRDNPAAPVAEALEIYLMNPDGTDPERLTNNAYGDAFPVLSPTAKRLVFDSNRARAVGEAVNTSDLFLMKSDGTDQTLLTRGSSGSWSPDGKYIAYHRSASGAGTLIRPADPGSATTDSDIFVINVDDQLNGLATPKNLTNNGNGKIDDDADWSPDGQTIIFTSHNGTPVLPETHLNATSAEIYKINADGTTGDNWERLTTNTYEERAPAWSPDGTRILFSCRIGNPVPPSTTPTFEICVMDADGDNLVRLTTNTDPDLTPSWSPNGQQILFHRPVGGPGRFQLFVMDAKDEDGPNGVPDGNGDHLKQLTDIPGINAFAKWGVLTDTTSPELTLPSDLTKEATSKDGAEIYYEASATDDLDGEVPVICKPASGDLFPIGATQVKCSATDNSNNLAEGSFNVIVQDTTAPEVSSTDPSNNKTGVPSSTTVSAKFTEVGSGIYRDSVIANDTFKLEQVKPTGNLKVSGTAKCESSSSCLNPTFVPSAPLPKGLFQATITTGVKDNAGNQLTKDYTWQFATAGPSKK